MWLAVRGERAGLGAIASASATSQRAGRCVQRRPPRMGHGTVLAELPIWNWNLESAIAILVPWGGG
jgi:hypothetical protein